MKNKNFLQIIIVELIMVIIGAFIIGPLMITEINGRQSNQPKAAVLCEYVVKKMSYDSTSGRVTAIYVVDDERNEERTFASYSFENIDKSVVRKYNNDDYELVVSLIDELIDKPQ